MMGAALPRQAPAAPQSRPSLVQGKPCSAMVLATSNNTEPLTDRSPVERRRPEEHLRGDAAVDVHLGVAAPGDLHLDECGWERAEDRPQRGLPSLGRGPKKVFDRIAVHLARDLEGLRRD